MSVLKELVTQACICFSNASNLTELEHARLKFFGKSGAFTQQVQEFKKLTLKERKLQIIILNKIKQQIEQALIMRRVAIKANYTEKYLKTEAIDVTLPGRGNNKGGIHPLMRSWQRVEKIFCSLGFDITDGPEIETDWINFTALNNPKNHPARSMQDTFYIQDQRNDQSLLLRTHTSSMQIRYVRSHKPPIKVIAPGRTYRVDNDMTHSPMFHQIEGLWISQNISFANLKYVYLNFIRVFFETHDLKIRFRPSYFPFTKPSAEIDVSFQHGVFKNRWLEVAGAGQVHPIVMHNMGLNPEKYLGFAFGTGLERLTMLRYGIRDVRLFYEGDLRFLEQFNY